jgi:hypothetical protein
MAIITAKAVLPYISDVTREQSARATRVIDESTMHPFYLVESERDSLVEYKVTYSETFGFQCTCPSGLHGFWNVRHPSGVCKHVRYALSAAEEYKDFIKAEAEAQARIDAEKAPVAPRQALYNKLGIGYASVDDVTLARIAERDAQRKAQPKKPARKVAYCQTRKQGFSLLK